MVSNVPSLTHANRHAAGGADPVTAASIGAQPAGNYVPATDAPSGVVELVNLFARGNSRGYNTGNAAQIWFDRVRTRLGSSIWSNLSVGGYLAADCCLYAFGSFNAVRQGTAVSAAFASLAAGTATAAYPGIFILDVVGDDAGFDLTTASGGTTAKSRAGFTNGLHSLIALSRMDYRVPNLSGHTPVVVTNGSSTVTDASIQAQHAGMLVAGTGIPAASYVGTITAGVSFVLSSTRGATVTPVNATAAGTLITLAPVETGTWATPLSGANYADSFGCYTNTNGSSRSYVVNIVGGSRAVHWAVMAIDASGSGLTGAAYSVSVDGGAAITGTTNDQTRKTNGAYAGTGLSQMCIPCGTLTAGWHTIVLTTTTTGSLVDQGLVVEALAPATVIALHEVPLSAAGYALFPGPPSYATDVIYNALVDAEVARWPADGSVQSLELNDDGTWDYTTMIGPDHIHCNDIGERWRADKIMKFLNQLSARAGLVKL